MALNVTLKNPANNGDPVPTTVQVHVDPVKGPDRIDVRVVLTDEANGDDYVYEATYVGGDMYEAKVTVTPGNFYTVVAVALLIDTTNGKVKDSGSDARIKCKA